MSSVHLNCFYCVTYRERHKYYESDILDNSRNFEFYILDLFDNVNDETITTITKNYSELVVNLQTKEECVIDRFIKFHIQHNRNERLVYHIGNDEYVINYFSNIPTHLYLMLIGLETYTHQYVPSNKCPSFDEMKEIVGDFVFFDDFDIINDNIYQKYQDKVKDLSEEDKIISFKNYLYAIALKNTNKTRPKTIEESIELYNYRENKRPKIWPNRKKKIIYTND